MPRSRIALACLLALSAAPALAQGPDIDKINGSITAEAGQAYGDLETVNGSIRIESGATLEDAETVNGSIKAADRIQAESLGTVNGDITVGAGSHVRGGILVEKPTGNSWFKMGKRKPPRIIVGPDARVDGPMVFEHEVKLYVHRTATVGDIRGATAIRYDGDRAPAD